MKIHLKNLIPLPIKELEYSNSDIWNNENLIFEKGKSYLVKAVSGKGKTTLLSVIYGLRKDYEGEVFFENENIKTYGLNRWTKIRKLKLSYLFQGLDLFQELTVLENILIKNKLTSYKTKNEILEYTELLQITNLLHKKTDKISFGQRQRVAIIRALCQPFDFLLLDEPFSHLDNENTKIILNLIRKECKEKKSSFILSSLNNEYDKNFDKILLI